VVRRGLLSPRGGALRSLARGGGLRILARGGGLRTLAREGGLWNLARGGGLRSRAEVRSLPWLARGWPAAPPPTPLFIHKVLLSCWPGHGSASMLSPFALRYFSNIHPSLFVISLISILKHI
jgi:hypothetical protein